jgi:hypothetical protein
VAETVRRAEGSSREACVAPRVAHRRGTDSSALRAPAGGSYRSPPPPSAKATERPLQLARWQRSGLKRRPTRPIGATLGNGGSSDGTGTGGSRVAGRAAPVAAGRGVRVSGSEGRTGNRGTRGRVTLPFTDVFELREGRWQIVASQGTRIAD